METLTIYHIRVKGHLDLHWADWFDGLTITHQENGETLLAGPIIDQAALYGLLLKVHNLNLTLLSVNRGEVVPPSPAGPAASPD
jgi:hypothetical protein